MIILRKTASIDLFNMHYVLKIGGCILFVLNRISLFWATKSTIKHLKTTKHE